MSDPSLLFADCHCSMMNSNGHIVLCHLGWRGLGGGGFTVIVWSVFVPWKRKRGTHFHRCVYVGRKMPKNNLHSPLKSFVAVKCCQSFQQIYISKSECECSVNRKPFNHLKYSASPTEREREMILLLSIAFEKLKH